LFKLFKTQLRVVHALALREIQSQQATLAYGYGWAIFDAFVAFGMLMVIKLAIKGFNRPGVPPFTFIVSGLVPWLLFQSTYSVPAGAIAKGKNLLQLPMVTEFDLILAASLRVFCTYALLFVVLAVVATYYDGVPFPRFPLGILLLFFNMSLMGIAFGLVLMVINRLYPAASKFTSIPLRFSLIVSGVVMPLSVFPPTVWPYLIWNPLLHVEELLRVYWFTNYKTPIVSPAYVAECLAGMLFLGLLVERYARRRIPQ
jgi:capsular polysaccharide transport system permease protein